MEPNAIRSAGRPKLDRSTIIDAAIARIERHGLENLSARKLGQDLECEAMSLYHHIGSMEDLKDLMVDRLLVSIPPAASEDAAEALAEEAHGYMALATSHPRTFPLIATRRWKGQGALAAAATAVARFVDLGFKPSEALARARSLGAYLNGAGLALAAWANDPDRPDRDAVRDVGADLQHGLTLLIASLTDRQ